MHYLDKSLHTAPSGFNISVTFNKGVESNLHEATSLDKHFQQKRALKPFTHVSLCIIFEAVIAANYNSNLLNYKSKLNVY